MGSGNEILIDAYKEGAENWDLSIKSLLESNGMLNFYIDDPLLEYPFIYKKVHQRLFDNFHNVSFGEINKPSSKLRTYALFKTEPGLEKYLTDVKNVSLRQHVTKLRLSNHRLEIETGRHDGIDQCNRLCKFCPNEIEDEAHFLFQCSLSSHLRSRYLEPLTRGIVGFEFFPVEFKLKALMVEVKYDTCKFIADAMDLRNFLIRKPKGNV